MNRTTIKLVAGFALASFAAACAPPKVLFNETASGPRLIQEYAVTASSGEKGFYDYHMRVCDLGDDGQLTQCKDSLILQNVSLGGR